MIFICTATYFEGESFIKKLSLKKDINITKFQVFKNNDITLIITGVGKIKATSALVHTFSIYNTQSPSLLINFGICGASNKKLPIGTTYLCNKLIDNSSKKTYYTDIIYNTPFEEACIETYDTIINVPIDYEITGDLIDMEAVGVYEGGSLFLHTHEIFIIKLISDYLDANSMNKPLVKEKINSATDEIINWLNFLSTNLRKVPNTISPKEAELINSIADNLKFSTTMKNDFKKELIYFKLSNGYLPDDLNQYSKIPCKSKREGKIYADSIRKELI